MSKESGSAAWQQAVLALSRIIAGVVVVIALSWGRAVLMPIALAILLTFLLNPVVRRLQLLGLGRCLAVILAVTFAGTAMTAVFFTGSRQVTSLLATLPENTTKIVDKLKALKALGSGPTALRFEQMIEDITHELRATPAGPQSERQDAPADATDVDQDPEQEIKQVVLASEPMSWTMLTGPLGTAMEGIAMLAFAGVLLVFFLMDREGLRDRIVLLAGKTRLTVTSKALEDATNRVSRYIGMVAIVNGGFGLLLTAGLFLLGVPYAVLWGCLAALLRFIPYLGPWIGAVFPIVMSLAMFDGWWQPIAVFGFVLVLELFTNNVVEPLAFGHTTGVAPTALLISAAFWLFLWGPVGLILSAPFAVSLVVMGKNIPQLNFLYILLADKPALSDEASLYQRLLVQDRHEAKLLLASRLRESNPERVFDQLVIPVLMNTKRDQQRGHLTQDEVDSLLQLLRELIDEIEPDQVGGVSQSQEEQDQLPARQHIGLLGYAVDGEADRIALSMLQRLLDGGRWDVELVPDETLTSELVARVAVDPPAAICIASIPPGGIAHVRYLCHKVKAVAPDLPLLIGRWGQHRIGQSDRVRLIEAGASCLTTTLVEARKWLEARYPVLCQPATESDHSTAPTREPSLSR